MSKLLAMILDYRNFFGPRVEVLEQMVRLASAGPGTTVLLRMLLFHAPSLTIADTTATPPSILGFKWQLGS